MTMTAAMNSKQKAYQRWHQDELCTSGKKTMYSTNIAQHPHSEIFEHHVRPGSVLSHLRIKKKYHLYTNPASYRTPNIPPKINNNSNTNNLFSLSTHPPPPPLRAPTTRSDTSPPQP